MQHIFASSVTLRITLSLLFPLFILVLTPMSADARIDGEIYAKSHGDLSGSTGKMDYQGYTYNVVKIGTQWWMAENLRATRYNDGSEIPHVMADKEWRRLKKTKSGAWCNYNNDPAIGNEFGKLYNWYAVNTGKLAPPGWHVPNDEDWDILTENLSIIMKLINGPLRNYKKDSEVDSVNAKRYGWHVVDKSNFSSSEKHSVSDTELFILYKKMKNYDIFIDLRKIMINRYNIVFSEIKKNKFERSFIAADLFLYNALNDSNNLISIRKFLTNPLYISSLKEERDGVGFIMKEWNHWINLGVNISGFRALPGGWRNFYGTFLHIPIYPLLGKQCYFWSNSSKKGRRPASFFALDDNTQGLYHGQELNSNGFSVRCVLN